MSYKPTTEELLPNGTIYKFPSVKLLPLTTEGLMPNAFIYKFTVLEYPYNCGLLAKWLHLQIHSFLSYRQPTTKGLVANGPYLEISHF